MRIKLSLLLALGVCHGGICATPEPKQLHSASAAPVPLLTKAELTRFIDTYEALIKKPGDPPTCSGTPSSDTPSSGPAYTCKIEIDLLAATATDGKVYCVAAIPPVVIIDDKDHKHEWDIQWNFVRKGFTDPVHFHADHGILVLGSSQLKKPKSGAQEFHFTHSNLSASKTFYVPIIIVGDEASDPGVCATGDPKIVNN
jgi:hypothetical protein